MIGSQLMERCHYDLDWKLYQKVGTAEAILMNLPRLTPTEMSIPIILGSRPMISCSSIGLPKLFKGFRLVSRFAIQSQIFLYSGPCSQFDFTRFPQVVFPPLLIDTFSYLSFFPDRFLNFLSSSPGMPSKID
jgi:hypothetical protein